MIFSVKAPERSKFESNEEVTSDPLEIVVTEKSISIPNYLNFQKKLVPEPGLTTFYFKDLTELEIVESSGSHRNQIPRHFRIALKNATSEFELKEHLFRITCSFEDEVKLIKVLEEILARPGFSLQFKSHHPIQKINKKKSKVFYNQLIKKHLKLALSLVLLVILVPTAFTAVKKISSYSSIDYVESRWPNGQLKSKEAFVNGKRNGVSQYFHDNGQLLSEVNFKDDLRDGAYRVYRKDGTLEGEFQMRMGKRHGLLRWFDKKGRLQREVSYANDQIIQ